MTEKKPSARESKAQQEYQKKVSEAKTSIYEHEQKYWEKK